jgi:hypothetical protein
MERPLQTLRYNIMSGKVYSNGVHLFSKCDPYDFAYLTGFDIHFLQM